MPRIRRVVGLPNDKFETNFWTLVDFGGTGCWEWAGCRDRRGYGKVLYQRRCASSHRAAFFLAHGYWPDEHVLHHCDNPSCVRPSHHFLGDNFTNQRDCVSKGRHATQKGTDRSPFRQVAKLDIRSAELVRARIAAGESQAAVARSMGVSRGAVNHIVKGRNYAHV